MFFVDQLSDVHNQWISGTKAKCWRILVKKAGRLWRGLSRKGFDTIRSKQKEHFLAELPGRPVFLEKNRPFHIYD